MPQTKLRHNHWKSAVIVFVCALAAILLFWNKQYITDQLTVWQYQPSSEIAAMVERSGMDGAGEFYFYASRPQLLDADAFNKTCERKEDATAILGCYNGHQIYIYNVNDPKLDGIREVTAAHEMLHAVYARLSESERQHVNQLIDAEYDKLKDDKILAERLAFYERTEPGERYNELHSIIGTEIANLEPELEKYFGKYFAERSQTVTLYQQYASVFDELRKRGEQLNQELTQLGKQIEYESAQYNADVKQFNQATEDFNRRAESGQFGSQAAFDSERASLVARGVTLESQRRAINDKVAHYEKLRAELIGIATETEALNQSIDSSLEPAPSL